MDQTSGMPDQNNKEICSILNLLLANEYVLYTKTRNAHWNVTGSNFGELHKFLEIQYELLDVMIDDIAVRVRSLGCQAMGSLKDFLSFTQIREENLDFSNSAQFNQVLISDHKTIIGLIRNEIIPISVKNNDVETVDFVTGLMEQHQKMVWMLRSFLSQPDFSAITHIRNVTKKLAENQYLNKTM